VRLLRSQALPAAAEPAIAPDAPAPAVNPFKDLNKELVENNIMSSATAAKLRAPSKADSNIVPGMIPLSTPKTPLSSFGPL